MNRRSKYFAKRPDFKALAEKHTTLAPFLVHSSSTGAVSIDFRNPDALRELTRVLLLEDYGIEWSLPEGHLVPPVPNRANYVHWVKDLLEYVVGERPHDTVQGVDIGTGASCIYCLLGAAIYGWRMLGTDVDNGALQAARDNVQRNPHLEHLVQLVHNPDPDNVLCGVIENALRVKTDGDDDNGELKEGSSGKTAVENTTEGDQMDGDGRLGSNGNGDNTGQDSGNQFLADFVMCNPPFFGSREQHMRNPRTACPATEGELIYRGRSTRDNAHTEEEEGGGGEVEFVKRMIADSLVLRNRVRIYTTMIGRKASLRPLKQELTRHGIRQFYTTEFIQGRTTRWGLAWTVSDVNDGQPMSEKRGTKRRFGASSASHAAFAESGSQTGHERQAGDAPLVKQRRVVVGSTMRQTVNTGTMSAVQLFDLITRELKRGSSGQQSIGVERVDKVDKMLCRVTVEYPYFYCSH